MVKKLIYKLNYWEYAPVAYRHHFYHSIRTAQERKQKWALKNDVHFDDEYHGIKIGRIPPCSWDVEKRCSPGRSWKRLTKQKKQWKPITPKKCDGL